MGNVIPSFFPARRVKDADWEDFEENIEPVFTGNRGRQYSLAHLMRELRKFYFTGWAIEEWVEGFFAARYGVDAHEVVAIAEATGKILREWQSGSRAMLSWPLAPCKVTDSNSGED